MITKDKVKTLAAKYHAEVVEMRRHLHAHPELSFVEIETSKYVASRLKDLGIEYRDGVVKTGIVALIKGQNPSKKTVALRSELDALPITEQNEVDYKSANPGVMHACGHDAHTASLLGAARILNELKDEFEGTVKLIFQPGEERLPGGASLMIQEGVLENPAPSAVYAQHVQPDLEAGKVGFRSGRYMASADELYITVRGKGGHGAIPQDNVDPVLIAAHLIVALQQLASRNAPPAIPTVLSVGKIIADGATNVIPGEVKMEGTFRTMDERWRADAHQRMKALSEGLAASMGGSCDFRIERGYPVLVNDAALTEKAVACAREYLGAENVQDLDLRMTSEDFSFYSQHVPVCFYRLGTGNRKKGITAQIHTPHFNVDEAALEIGAGLLAWIAVCGLSQHINKLLHHTPILDLLHR